MSITLDVNAFLNNNDICTQSGCNGGAGGENSAAGAIGHNKIGEMQVDDITMEKEMEINGSIFDEIEHLLKFNKNLEFPKAASVTAKHEENNNKLKKSEGSKQQETFTLDFLTSHTDDFLLASDTQSILSEEPLLFSVEKDHLQPLTSRFMVPGIYKRIEGVDRIDIRKNNTHVANVFITCREKTGRIIKATEFDPFDDNVNNELSSMQPLIMSNAFKDDNIEPATKYETNKSIENSEEREPPNREWDALQRLATDIYKLNCRDHIVIDVKRNEIIKTQYETNQKTVYRLRHPDMMGLKTLDSNTKTNNKVKAFSMSVKNKLCKTKNNNKKKATVKASTRTDVTNKSNDGELKESNISINHTRTRSGRLVKTIQPINQTSAITTDDLPPSPKDSLADVLTDLRDQSFKCSKSRLNKREPSPESTSHETLPPIENSPTNRKIPTGANCPTCHKIFLGKRLQKHFAQNPDHMKVPVFLTNGKHQTTTDETPTSNSPSERPNSSCDDISLFRFLVNKLNKSQQLNEDQKADLFLSELNDLVEQLQIRSSRLIHNTSGLHFVNQKCAKLLGIPEGQYALDMTAIEGPLEPDMHDNNHNNNNHTSANSINSHLNSRCLDYTNLSITLDNTLTDEAAQKLNLSAGGKLLPPSEESLLRAVDDLVQTDITKLQTTDHCVNTSSALPSRPPCKPPKEMVVANMLPPHIDHVSDNAVEAAHMKETLPNVVVVNASENPLLDLSVDFFQFNN